MPKIIFIDHYNFQVLAKIIDIVLEQKLDVKFVDMQSLHTEFIESESDFVFSLSVILKEEAHNKENKQKIGTFKCTKLKCTINDTAMIMFTTNKTGVPKCVNIPYRIFTSPVNQQIPMCTKETGMLLPSDNLPFYLIMTVRAVILNVTLISVPKYTEDYKERICRLIEKFKVL